MQNIIKKEGFDFLFDPKACQNCEGNCCIGESGYIWVSKEEIKSIAGFLNIKEKEFIDNFLKKIKYRYTIKEIVKNKNFQCLFFDEKNRKCQIYPVRPKQCRTFPFWDRYKDKNYIEEVKNECPGIITK